MNDFPNSKRGSALMIVIGFLAFMIVSAVSFSIYMRSERLPSSALRRTVATRQLVKAALAEAIARVDDAVRGAPFPGLNDAATATYQPRGRTEDNWTGRVFTPPNVNVKKDADIYAAPATETVSVLTLEGLGYVPAPLINDARFLGRSTWTAAWQNLPYDAGRFAFVALNVSDYFDVNRLYANKPRTSNADGRISLAYLFDQSYRPAADPASGSAGSAVGTVDGFSAGDTARFDQLVHEQRASGNDKNPIGQDSPYVSMLDWNLGMRDTMVSIMPSLFYKWINDSGADKVMYASSDANMIYAARQPFVTESCATNDFFDVDISYYQSPVGKRQKGQPFDTEVKSDTLSLSQLTMSAITKSQFFTALLASKSGSPIKFGSTPRELSMFASMMYDYLDHNDIPISLAWPCVERVPMLSVVEPAFKFMIPNVQASTQGKTTQWMFDPNQWIQPGMLAGVWTFPFKRNETERNDAFKAQAIVRVFLAPVGLNLRPNGDIGKVLRPQNAADWTKKVNMFELNGMTGVFCLTFTPNEQMINLPGSVMDDDQAGGLVKFEINLGSIGNINPTPLVTRTVVQNQQNQGGQQEQYTVNVTPLGLDGKPMFPVGTVLDSAQFNAAAGQELKPYVCVWVRIINGDGKTVDLVPAVADDDQTLNGINNTGNPMLREYNYSAAQSAPLLRFEGDKSFRYSEMVSSAAAGGGMVEWSPASFSTLDPRFNWAPEDWYATDEGAANSFSDWFNKVNTYLGSGEAESRGCDSDIFCAVSNQGFLQSLGEVAFLPRLTDIDGGGVALLAMLGGGGYDGVVRTSAQQIANIRCAWCSYSMDREVYDYFNSCGIGRSLSRECLVNPYTPDRAIMMAALANTPCDYWAAGVALDKEENKLKQTLGDDSLPTINDAAAAVQKYAFSERNNQAHISCKELTQIAEVLQANFRDTSRLSAAKTKLPSRQMADAWEEVWDDLNWMPSRGSPNFENFLGVQLESSLYGIDRKFLYSYWRDCFANRQQLFLIFMRAESSAIGGPGEGTPGQKGARAVALVWRNPAATTDTSTGEDGRVGDENTSPDSVMTRRPHQTRVLFYHQFD
ncbi:MAG: hypothetical protein IKL96_05780 [Kiritimatiellae bacterium]|nr:hypothetical protein [Kiritimatiellia bacterium]